MAANQFYMHPRRDSDSYGINVQQVPGSGIVALDFISDGVAVTLLFESAQSLMDHIQRLHLLAPKVPVTPIQA